MVKLQDLRNPRHVKWPLYFLFAVIFVSFVFFYGWHPTDADRNPGTFGKLRSESLNPFKQWTYIRKPQMAEAQTHLTRYKEGLLPPYVRQVFQRQGMGLETVMSRIITPEEVAQDAANLILIERAARDMGVVVTRDTIINSLKQQPGLTDEMLEQIARQMNLQSANELVDLERRTAEMERVRNIKGMVAHASLFELWQEYSLANDKLTLRLAAFPNDEFTSKVLVTDKDIQDYFNAHKDDYRVPAQRRYVYIKVSRDEISKKINPTPDQLLAFYNEHKANYTEPAAVQARELYVTVAGGQPIEPVMAVMNDMRTSAAATNNWDALADTIRDKYKLNIYSRTTPWLSQGTTERPTSYMEQLVALSDDKVSSPILTTQTADGVTTSVTLAKVTARRPEGTKPFDQVREQVRTAYITDETDRQLKERADQWKAAKAKVKNIAELAKSVGTEDHITTLVDALDYRIPGVGAFRENADYIAGLAQDDISDPIPSEDGLVVLQPTDTVEAHDQPLAAVRSKVITAIQVSKSGDLARQAAQNALKLVQSGAKFDQAMADAPIKPVTTDPQTRMESVKVLGAPLIDFQRQTLRVAKGSVGMSPYGAEKDHPMGYAVWTVVDLQPTSIQQFAANRQAFERDYLEIQRLAIANEWLRDQRVKAKFEATKTEK